jgi:hypothetical protein
MNDPVHGTAVTKYEPISTYISFYTFNGVQNGFIIMTTIVQFYLLVVVLRYNLPCNTNFL